MNVDVVVIGGGIAGINIAHEIVKTGCKVAIVEKNKLASGTSGETTGKATVQHGLFYSSLIETVGIDKARLYAEANQQGFDKLKKIIEKNNIECDWTIKNSFVYTSKVKNIVKFEQEASSAKTLGLDAIFEKNTELPFNVTAAVRFNDQAYINLKKYIIGVARLIQNSGGLIFENSNVEHIEYGKKPKVITKNGSINAGAIILATKIPPGPLFARLGYAALEHPETSYIVAGRPSKNIKDMYISTDKGHYSLLQIKTPTEPLLLVGGEAHTPGVSTSEKHYRRLSEYAKQNFGVENIKYRWKSMDYIAYDNIPLIGKLYPNSNNIYVATGFKKWGITTSMVSAEILRDLILSKHNPWKEVFDSTRGRTIRYIPKTIKNKVKRKLTPKKTKV